MVTGLLDLPANPLEFLLSNFFTIVPQLLFVLAVLVIIFVVYEALTFVIKRLLKRAMIKRMERHRIVSVWKYMFLFIAAILIIVSFSGSLESMGLSVALLSAALGWALQKPITGIAAWLMLMINKPFKVGDRVIIDKIQGDIGKITMFYIVLNEFGGTVTAEEVSGRQILIPTAILFDKPIINYTLDNPYVLDELTVSITYESNLKKAKELMKKAATEATKAFSKETGKTPYTRQTFTPNGLDMRVVYYTVVMERYKIKDNITELIYESFGGEKDLAFAYPHTEIVYRGKAKL